ncbi:MAG: protein-glutamate O-methyltransferase family protein [Chloroflexi bacterium]|nr:protein-glutamate O-methyltransferase family protein [Chloroflexota bacterium]
MVERKPQIIRQVIEDNDYPSHIGGALELRELGRSNLVILKGDVNYRRLLDDRHWPHTMRLEEVGDYFPLPFLVLRTLRCPDLRRYSRSCRPWSHPASREIGPWPLERSYTNSREEWMKSICRSVLRAYRSAPS